ncbi:hypothetical protein I4U23_029853 [Adineta vaga]|nr:hypothetical protein I4U23_029853 [Adineta vaga]
MAFTNCQDNESKFSDDCLSSTISSSTLEIVLDDQSSNNSEDDENLNDHARQSEAGTTKHDDQLNYRRNKQTPIRNPKSHRLIEKRRRDRMNSFLVDLLELVPHDNTHGQRRIEKTEIIEMAIKHIRYLLSKLEKKSQTDLSNLNTYRIGYGNALSDLYDFLHEYSDSKHFLMDIVQFLKEKDLDLKSLTDLPDKKRPKYMTISNKQTKLSPVPSISPKDQIKKSSLSDKDDERLCVISEVTGSKYNELTSSMDERSNSHVKVPIFVLHPSGTHYIPMCIDASVVSHVFEKKSNLTHSSFTSNQVHCHPVSIPVNFNPAMTLSDPYELDIQNINVIGTRHQTSVRPN